MRPTSFTTGSSVSSGVIEQCDSHNATSMEVHKSPYSKIAVADGCCLRVEEILAITLDPWPGWCEDTVREASALILHSYGSCLHCCGPRYSLRSSCATNATQ